MASLLRYGVVAALLVGCSAPATEVASRSQGQGVVSDETFKEAYTTIQGIDYLPFDYKADGCYARAYYMSMELAAREIESNAVFAFQKVDAKGHPAGPQPSFGSESWVFHVAPVIEVSAALATNKMVVDPALGAHPFALDEWLSTMNVTEDDVTLVLMKGAVLDAESASDLAQAQGGSLSEKLTENFADMPLFKVADVQSACRTMHTNLYYEAHEVDYYGEPLPGADPVLDADALALAAPKRTKLLARTSELVQQLAELGKLDADGPPFSAETCADHSDVALDP